MSEPFTTTRRDFLQLSPKQAATALAGAVAASVTQAASTDKTDDIIYMSATKLAGLIRAGKVTATDAVEAFIKRQIHVNDALNAVVTNSWERARVEAKELDAKAARGEFVGPRSAFR